MKYRKFDTLYSINIFPSFIPQYRNILKKISFQFQEEIIFHSLLVFIINILGICYSLRKW